jgi:hypothetical protein
MAELVCRGCGERFVPARRDAVHCSHACRQRAYRLRRVTAISPAEPTVGVA